MYRRKQARDRLRGGPGWGDCRCPTDSHSIDRIADYFDKRVRDQVDGDEAPPGPSPVSLGLLELLSDVGDAQPTVLDLGCGTGASSVRLMQEGARQVMGLDASPASVELARSRATSAGLNETVARFRVGDAATMTLPRHDWVLLDRVVCCYQDSHSLLTSSRCG
jgi:2-polyprenyl-3-methyl-5-hydroxy-6-metoxy-1,4-benzoquinol methylase